MSSFLKEYNMIYFWIQKSLGMKDLQINDW